MNQFPRLTPRTFSPVENAGTLDPGSVYHTRLEARDGVATIKVATVDKRVAPNMVTLGAAAIEALSKSAFEAVIGWLSDLALLTREIVAWNVLGGVC